MREQSFYKLPRTVQERFLGALSGRLAPVPLFSTPFVEPPPYVWLALPVVSLLLLLAFIVVGHGKLDGALAYEGFVWLLLYMGLVFAFVFGIARVVRTYQRAKAFPFRRGIYVFPMSIIDARSEVLKVHPSDDLTGITGPEGPRAVVRFSLRSGATFAFEVGDPERAGEALRLLEEARRRIPEAVNSQDANALSELDPLYEPKFSSPVGPAKSMVKQMPTAERYGWPVALGVALVVGPALWVVRNTTSDDAMFRIAHQRNDPEGYRLYLERGSRHGDEVRHVLLPRAELAEATKAGSVQAIRSFIAAHTDTRIKADVDSALRNALLGELAQARQAGTLAALQAFARNNPGHGLDAELKDATHAVYKNALEQYRAKAPEKERGAVAFMERLLNFAEVHGPKVELRFRRLVSKSLPKADASVAKNPMFMGSASTPSRYFAPSYEDKREAHLGKLLTERLQSAFPSELVTFEMGAPVLDPEAAVEYRVPTLLLDKKVEWPIGAEVRSKAPRGVFVSLAFTYEPAFRIPGEAKPFTIHQEIRRGPPLEMLREEKDASPGHPPAGSAEERIYEAMTRDSDELFAKRYLALFFKKG
jgi:hypothetical protein